MPSSSESEKVLLEVEFSPGGKHYSYLADSDAYATGTYVVVLAGKDNHEATVRIVGIRDLSQEESTNLSAALKRVLRHANENEIEAFSKPQGLKQKKAKKQSHKKADLKYSYNEPEPARPYDTEGLQPDGSLIVSYYDSASDFYGGDVEVIYKLDPENTELLREYLSRKYYGNVESMFYQECGQNCMKKGPTELFEEIGVKYERFVWIS